MVSAGVISPRACSLSIRTRAFFYFTNKEIITMAKKSVDTETQTIGFDFGEGVDAVGFDLSKCSPAMLIQLALHGASQKIGDSYASAKSAVADTDIDPAAWSSGQAAGVVAQLYSDDWTVRSAGSAAVTDLATALAEAVGCDIEAATSRLADADKDEKASLRKHPAVAAVLTRIKAERAAAKAAQAEAKAETGDDLSGFMDA
jgi:hypothetical protein